MSYLEEVIASCFLKTLPTYNNYYFLKITKPTHLKARESPYSVKLLEYLPSISGCSSERNFLILLKMEI